MVAFAGRTETVSTLNSAQSALSFRNSSCAQMGGCNELSAAGSCVVAPSCAASASASASACAACQCNDGYAGTNCQLASVDTWLSDVVVYDVVSNAWVVFDADPVGTANPVPWSAPVSTASPSLPFPSPHCPLLPISLCLCGVRASPAGLLSATSTPPQSVSQRPLTPRPARVGGLLTVDRCAAAALSVPRRVSCGGT